MKKYILFIICLVLLCGCSKNPKENPIATFEIQDYGVITIELYPKIAKNTVANFVNLIEDGFYDNNNFHRLAKGFVLQGGDPTATGTGGPGYTIKGEFSLNGYTNKLSHLTGIISMARSEDYNSAGSQFFIVLSDDAKTSLDGKYAAFGKVIDGMNVIEDIANSEEIENEATGKLKENIKINKVTVETFGKTYKVKKYSK